MRRESRSLVELLPTSGLIWTAAVRLNDSPLVPLRGQLPSCFVAAQGLPKECTRPWLERSMLYYWLLVWVPPRCMVIPIAYLDQN